MSATATLVRLARYATDPIVPYSFNRMGFEMNRRGFDPSDLPQDVRGRVALVTGANSGIGRAAARELARRGFDVWLLCRDRARGTEARDCIAREVTADRTHLEVVDLSSLASIRRLAQELPLERVDVLVHNAGVLPHEMQRTEDGVELTFAANVLGPFALTGLLLDRLSRSDDARVVFVTSGGLYPQRLDLSLLEVEPVAFDGVRAYANAKRAQVILTHMLADRLSSQVPITFASMHPGWADTTAVRTSLPRFYSVMKSFLRTPEQGADTVVWLAASESPKGSRGKLWFDRRVAPEHVFPWTRESPAARRELFDVCEERSGVKLPARMEKAA
jgi:dehydrogenase/reductase SDR family member 12